MEKSNIHGMPRQKACFSFLIWQIQEAVRNLQIFTAYLGRSLWSLPGQNGMKILQKEESLWGAGGHYGAGNRNMSGICTVHSKWNPPMPVYKAYAGDRVIFRTMMPADKPRNVSLTIHGHLWREQPKDALSREIPLQGGISIGNRFDMELKDGAASPGDYLYRSESFGWDLESGMWGIFRVMERSVRCKCKEICRKIFAKNRAS